MLPEKKTKIKNNTVVLILTPNSSEEISLNRLRRVALSYPHQMHFIIEFKRTTAEKYFNYKL